MSRSKRGRWLWMPWITGTTLTACTLAGGQHPGRYATPEGPYWSHAPASPQGAGQPWTRAGTDPSAALPGPTNTMPGTAIPTPTSQAMPGGAPDGETTLERLQRTGAELKAALEENEMLKANLASLTETLDQLKKDNESMQELVQSMQSEQKLGDQAEEQLAERLTVLEQRQRELAEDLLAERIRRVRVERELILAKISEAERAQDG